MSPFFWIILNRPVNNPIEPNDGLSFGYAVDSTGNAYALKSNDQIIVTQDWDKGKPITITLAKSYIDNLVERTNDPNHYINLKLYPDDTGTDKTLTVDYSSLLSKLETFVDITTALSYLRIDDFNDTISAYTTSLNNTFSSYLSLNQFNLMSHNFANVIELESTFASYLTTNDINYVVSVYVKTTDFNNTINTFLTLDSFYNNIGNYLTTALS